MKSIFQLFAYFVLTLSLSAWAYDYPADYSEDTNGPENNNGYGNDPYGEFGNTNSDGQSWSEVMEEQSTSGSSTNTSGSTSTTNSSTAGNSSDYENDGQPGTTSTGSGNGASEESIYNAFPKEDPESALYTSETGQNPYYGDVANPQETMDYMEMMHGNLNNPDPSPESVVGRTDTFCNETCEQRDGRYGVINREYFNEVYNRQKKGELSGLSNGPIDALHNHGLANEGVARGGANSVEKDLDEKVRRGEWVVRMGGQSLPGYQEDPAVSKKNKLGQKKSITVVMPEADMRQYLGIPPEKKVPGGAAFTHSVSTTAPGGVVMVNYNNGEMFSYVTPLDNGVSMPLGDFSSGGVHNDVADHEYSHAGEVAMIKEVENLRAKGLPVPEVLQSAAASAMISQNKKYLYVPDGDDLSSETISDIQEQALKERYYFTVTEILAFSSQQTVNGQAVGTTSDRWKNGVMGKFGITSKQAQAVFHEIVTNDELYDLVVKPMEEGAQHIMGEANTTLHSNPNSGLTQTQIDQIYFGN